MILILSSRGAPVIKVHFHRRKAFSVTQGARTNYVLTRETSLCGIQRIVLSVPPMRTHIPDIKRTITDAVESVGNDRLVKFGKYRNIESPSVV
jgi:hypothetical protein